MRLCCMEKRNSEEQKDKEDRDVLVGPHRHGKEGVKG